jgi:PTH1 family peptidyl-tRNA hydrolase
MTAHIGNDYLCVRIGIGHPGRSDRVKGYVLHNFAKADSVWLKPLLDAIAAEAPLLAEGSVEKFQSRVAHAMQKVAIPQAPSPQAGPAPAEGLGARLRRWLGS